MRKCLLFLLWLSELQLRVDSWRWDRHLQRWETRQQMSEKTRWKSNCAFPLNAVQRQSPEDDSLVFPKSLTLKESSINLTFLCFRMNFCFAHMLKSVTDNCRAIEKRGRHNFSAASLDRLPVRQMNFASVNQLLFWCHDTSGFNTSPSRSVAGAPSQRRLYCRTTNVGSVQCLSMVEVNSQHFVAALPTKYTTRHHDCCN